MATTSTPRVNMARAMIAGNSPSPATNPTQSGIVINPIMLRSVPLPRTRPATDAAFRPLDEGDQALDFSTRHAILAHALQRLGGIEPRAVERMIGAAKLPSHRGSETET